VEGTRNTVPAFRREVLEVEVLERVLHPSSPAAYRSIQGTRHAAAPEAYLILLLWVNPDRGGCPRVQRFADIGHLATPLLVFTGQQLRQAASDVLPAPAKAAIFKGRPVQIW
jgi:hypothetical protein